jgi:hypothetical protein
MLGAMSLLAVLGVIECLIVVVSLVLIPWRYVFENFVKRDSDSWGRGWATRLANNLIPPGSASG